jgi:hypothetical protein
VPGPCRDRGSIELALPSGYVRMFAIVGLGSLKSAAARSAVEGRLKVESSAAVRSTLLEARNRQEHSQ